MDNKDNVNLNNFYTGSAPKKKKIGFKKWWKKRKQWQKVALISAVALFLVLAIVGTSLAIYFHSLLGKIQRDDGFDDSTDLGFTDVIDKNVYNIALFGVDTREVGDFSGKSDSMMILSINKTDNKIRLVSVMRDSLVPYENKGKKGYTKITEIYAFGGPELAVKTLNTVYGLDISEYATVNFYGMSDIIEAVGGIDVELTYDEIDPKNAKNINDMIGEQCEHLGLNPKDYYVNKTGKVHLNGVQAVAYARIRYGRNIWGSNNDFGRTERQRYVMQELFKKALAMDVTSYPNLVKKLSPHVKTSFTNSELLGLAKYLVNKPTMEVSRVPSDEYIINADYRGTGASTVYYNYKYAGKVLRAFFYEGITPEDYMKQNGVDKTPWHSAPSNGGSTGNNSNSQDSSISQDSSSSEDSSSSGDSSSSSDGSSSDTSTSQTPNTSESTSTDSGNSNSNNSGNESTPSTPEVSNPENSENSTTQ